jgi:hypothetical protein
MVHVVTVATFSHLKSGVLKKRALKFFFDFQITNWFEALKSVTINGIFSFSLLPARSILAFLSQPF